MRASGEPPLVREGSRSSCYGISCIMRVNRLSRTANAGGGDPRGDLLSRFISRAVAVHQDRPRGQSHQIQRLVADDLKIPRPVMAVRPED